MFKGKIADDKIVLKSLGMAHYNIMYIYCGHYIRFRPLVFPGHGVQRRMISVDNFFVLLRLLFFAVMLLYVT